MKRICCFSILTLLVTAFSALAQTPYHRPPGMPDNTLLAFDAFQPVEATPSFQQLFAVSSFRWMLQVPTKARLASVIISFIDTETGESREITRFAFNPVPVNPAKRDTRPTFFPVSLSLLPRETVAENPWQESRQFLALMEIPDLAYVFRQACANPLRKLDGIAIFNTTRMATPLERKSGVWEGFGTAFDIMAGGEADRYRLRVVFECSHLLGGE